jgi:hypothetical protein
MKNTHRYEQKCQSHTCSETINSSMYDNDLTIPTSPLTSSAPRTKRPVISTILWTEFLLQFQKQWENSAILLASNRPDNKNQTKKDRKEKEYGKTKNQVGLQEAPPLTWPEAKSF